MKKNPSNPIISVIIPVYNSEKTLSRCLDSIIQQTFQHIEIILVNDSSNDNSQYLIELYAKQDSRIRYFIHAQNKGAGGARNTGLHNMNGEWIIFVDADDYITNNMIEILYYSALKHNVKIVQCSHKRFNDKLKPYKISVKLNKDIMINDPFKSYCLGNSLITNVIWDKIWHNSLFINNNIYFPENIYGEDKAVLILILNTINQIAVIPNMLYFYYFNDNANKNKNSMSEFPIYHKYIYDKILVLSKNLNNDLLLLDKLFTHQANEAKFFYFNLSHSDENSLLLFKTYYGKYAHLALSTKNKWYQPNASSMYGKMILKMKQISKKLKIYPILVYFLKN